MTDYLKRAHTARTLKAVILNRPPHAHLSGDTGAVPDTAVATLPQMVGRSPGGWDFFSMLCRKILA